MGKIGSIVGIGAGVISILMVGGLEDGTPDSWLQWVIAIGSTAIFGYIVYRYTMNRTEEIQQERDDMRRHVNKY